MKRKHPNEFITEADLTIDLFQDTEVRTLKRNCFFYSSHFESDIILLYREGHYVEIEFKNNFSDYELDFTKCIGRMKTNDTRRRRKPGDERVFKHDLIKQGKTGLQGFWFACPVGVIQEKDLPEHAGLLWIDKDLFGRVFLQLIRTAPLLPDFKRLTPHLEL